MRRRTPVAALALAAPLLLSAPSVGSDPLSDAGSSQAAGAVCEANPQATPQRSVNEEMARLAARGQLPANQDVVMLNGRGYNYGPPPDQQLEMIRLDALKAEAELRKRRTP